MSIYGRQRHIYDLTRKYFLLGRDTLYRGFSRRAGGSVIEIGCGTGTEPHRRRPRLSRCGTLRPRRLLGDAVDGPREHPPRRT